MHSIQLSMDFLPNPMLVVSFRLAFFKHMSAMPPMNVFCLSDAGGS